MATWISIGGICKPRNICTIRIHRISCGGRDVGMQSRSDYSRCCVGPRFICVQSIVTIGVATLEDSVEIVGCRTGRSVVIANDYCGQGRIAVVGYGVGKRRSTSDREILTRSSIGVLPIGRFHDMDAGSNPEVVARIRV